MTAHYTTVISVAELKALPKAPVIFDTRFDLAAPESGADAFLAGHIPGAQYLHLDEDLSGPKTGSNGRHPLPDRWRLAATLGEKGLHSTLGQQVVVYDEQAGMFAARAWWLLRWLGYGRVAVLDGGLGAWRGAGLPLESRVPDTLSAQFVPTPSLVGTVGTDTVLAGLSEPVVIDARSPDRYRGENETLDPAAGHIPGARNRFFRDNLRADGRFKDAEQLRAEFAQVLGDLRADKVIHQCGSGVTACHNLLAFEIAGLTGSKLYPGSWSEWVSNPDRPIATGQPI